VNQTVFSFLAQGGLITGLGLWLCISLRSGKLLYKGGVIYRDLNPRLFWSSTALVCAFVGVQALLLLLRLNDFASCGDQASLRECAATTLRAMWDAHSFEVKRSD
jgi:hypothetical protein